jgi:hypothetical protein
VVGVVEEKARTIEAAAVATMTVYYIVMVVAVTQKKSHACLEAS